MSENELYRHMRDLDEWLYTRGLRLGILELSIDGGLFLGDPETGEQIDVTDDVIADEYRAIESL